MKKAARMKIWNDLKLRYKILLVMLCIGILPIGSLSILNYKQATENLLESSMEQVESVRELKKSLIETYLQERLNNAKSLSINALFNNGVTDFSAALSQGSSSIEYQQTMEKYNGGIQFIKDTYGYQNIYLINRRGVVVYNTSGNNIGKNIENSEIKLLEAFKNGLSNTYITDYEIENSSGKAVLYASAPIIRDAVTQGVLVIALPSDPINNILVQKSNSIKTREVYLVGEDFLLRSPVKLSSDIYAFRDRIDTLAVQEALQGKVGAKTIKDYQGDQALTAYTPLEIHGIKWALISQLNQMEVLRSTRSILTRSLLVLFITSIAITAVALLFSSYMSNLIQKVMSALGKAEGGDLTVSVEHESEDEIGYLSKSLNKMIGTQREAIVEVLNTGCEVSKYTQNQLTIMKELTVTMDEMAASIGEVANSALDIASNTNQVSTSIGEMSNAIDDVSKSASDTSSTILEMIHSMEEMDGSIQKIAQHSLLASEEAKKTVNIAEKGKQNANHTILEMDLINTEMSNLQEVIKGLGKAALQIGDIIEVINAIAEQTNLLSLNASIEAARAGEHGKGFAVVASAISSLADKSRNATKDIANLVKDIQGIVEEAVEKTQQGASKVEHGVTLVKNTSSALENIYEAIEKTTVLINDIAKATEEQTKTSKEVMGASQKVTALSLEVSSSVEEQAASIEEISKSIDKLNELSQAVAGAVQQQSAGAEEVFSTTQNITNGAQDLEGMMTSLLKLISRFDVKS